jgi:hypothetical protein
MLLSQVTGNILFSLGRPSLTPPRNHSFRSRNLHLKLHRYPSPFTQLNREQNLYTSVAGRTRVDRLLHVGLHSVPLAVESLKLVIKALKQTNDIIRYKYTVSVLQKIAPSDPDARLDEDWADRTSRKVANEMEQMEAALKSYKHNLIKESIRVYLSLLRSGLF